MRCALKCAPTQENALLLATCYMRSKQTYRAYSVLKGASVLALCNIDRRLKPVVHWQDVKRLTVATCSRSLQWSS